MAEQFVSPNESLVVPVFDLPICIFLEAGYNILSAVWNIAISWDLLM